MSLIPPSRHERYMRRALDLAAQAASLGEVPVGAVVVLEGVIIGEGHNSPITHSDPSAHAEIRALRDACQRLGNYRLADATLYVTIEPCTMCTGAMMHARIAEVIYGASEPRAGAIVSNLHLPEQSCYNHTLRWQGGILAEESRALMQAFFHQKRNASDTDHSFATRENRRDA